MISSSIATSIALALAGVGGYVFFSDSARFHKEWWGLCVAVGITGIALLSPEVSWWPVCALFFWPLLARLFRALSDIHEDTRDYQAEALLSLLGYGSLWSGRSRRH